MKLENLNRAAVKTTGTAAKVVSLDAKAMKNVVGGRLSYVTAYEAALYS
jgi:hypothetical protein